MKRRVVVTGLGLVLPNGIGVEEAWRNTCEGRSGIGPITRFDTSQFETKIAGEVKGFNPEDYVERKEIRRMDLFIQYAVAASEMAVEDSGLEIDEAISDRIGVIIGTGLGGLPTLEEYHKVLLEKGPNRITPFFIPKLIANMAAGHVAMHHKARGPNTCVVTACATGAHCIGDAFRAIHYGDADAIITG
ncbi:MAG: beta-ketoacyl synthase N-terminal-like domain-containing protein, partial [Thermodesulfobacteriota bacterium]